MSFKEITQQTLADFKPQLEKFTKKDWLWTLSLSAVILWGAYALYQQIVQGEIVTGMRDNVVWGLYIANFIFFIGLSYAGAIISAILHLLNVDWGKPIIRMAKLMTVITVIIGPVFILLCMGRLDRLHHLFLYLRLQSPISWDVIAIATFFVGALLYLYVSVVRDFSILRTSDLKMSKARKKFYKFFSLGYRNTPEQKKKLMLSMKIIALIMIPTVVVVSSVLSWIFGLTLRPGWHSTIFGPYFVLASIYSGVGVLILLMYFYRKYHNLSKYLTIKQFKYMGYAMVILAATYGYFTFSEYFTDWYSSEKWSSELIHKLFSWDEFGGLFLFANLGGIALPLIVMAIPKWRTINAITIVAGIMVLAMWVKRYLIVIPTLETTLLPMQDTRVEYTNYSATWVEWALTFAGIAAFILMFRLASKVMPILPLWANAKIIAKENNIDPKSSAHV